VNSTIKHHNGVRHFGVSVASLAHWTPAIGEFQGLLRVARPRPALQVVPAGDESGRLPAPLGNRKL